jgi:AraC-like DNA-binding protein
MSNGSARAAGGAGDGFVSFDIDPANEHLARLGIGMRLGALGPAAGRIELGAFGQLLDGVTCMRAGFEQRIEMRPLTDFDAYGVLIGLAGTIRVDLGGEVVDCSQDGAAIFDLEQTCSLQSSSGAEGFLIFIDRKVLTRRLFELTGVPVARRLHFATVFDVAQPDIAVLRTSLAALDRSALVTALTGASHSARRLAALLVDLLLEILPHNYSDDIRRVPNLIVPKHVKRTLDYIQSNAETLVTVEELVAVAGVSLRALQYGFKKFLGFSISEYERSVRLDRVRRQIEADSEADLRDVARRWGFSNMTRFNAQFEAAFGVSASALRAGAGPVPSSGERTGTLSRRVAAG